MADHRWLIRKVWNFDRSCIVKIVTVFIPPTIIIIDGKHATKSSEYKIPEQYFSITNKSYSESKQNIKSYYITKKCKFRKHRHTDLSHADIVIKSVDDIDLSFYVVQPDLHRKPFGVLRSKQIDPPNRNK